MKVMVLGAGTMGSGIAQAFAVSGYQVIVRDLQQAFVDIKFKNIFPQILRR